MSLSRIGLSSGSGPALRKAQLFVQERTRKISPGGRDAGLMATN